MHDHAGTVIGGSLDSQVAPGAALHQPGDHRQLGAHVVEHDLGRGAVEADDHHSFGGASWA